MDWPPRIPRLWSAGGTFISGMRHDNGMGLLLVTVIIAFIGEQIRLAGGRA